MKQTICDVCGDKIPGESHADHTICINNGTVRFKLELTAGADICYYCAQTKAYEAACKWKKEADQSEEGRRRLKKEAR